MSNCFKLASLSPVKPTSTAFHLKRLVLLSSKCNTLSDRDHLILQKKKLVFCQKKTFVSNSLFFLTFFFIVIYWKENACSLRDCCWLRFIQACWWWQDGKAWRNLQGFRVCWKGQPSVCILWFGNFFLTFDSWPFFFLLLHSVKLKAFKKFENTTDALSAVTGIVEGKMPKNLKKFLETEISEKEMKKEKLVISDPKLGMCC